MNTMVWTYIAYLTVSVGLTMWVARTLRRNGKVFLVERLEGSDSLADSLVHLLVVGFYLINIGFITLALKFGSPALDVQSAIELLSTKVGYVLVVLGMMHFMMLAVFAKARQSARDERARSNEPVFPQKKWET